MRAEFPPRRGKAISILSAPSTIRRGYLPLRNVSLVIARSERDEAIQGGAAELDCFAELVIGPATSGRARWFAMTSILATPPSRPSFANHDAKINSPPAKRGRRSAERRIQPIPRSTGQRCRLPMPGRGGAPCRQVYAVCTLICLRGALAFRRYTAALARTFTSWLSSRPCLLGSVRADILPALSGSQSSGSTPRLGRSTEGNDAQSRSGAGCEPARKHRTRSTLQIASGMRPSMSEILWLVTEIGTNVKR